MFILGRVVRGYHPSLGGAAPRGVTRRSVGPAYAQTMAHDHDGASRVPGGVAFARPGTHQAGYSPDRDARAAPHRAVRDRHQRRDCRGRVRPLRAAPRSGRSARLGRHVPRRRSREGAGRGRNRHRRHVGGRRVVVARGRPRRAPTSQRRRDRHEDGVALVWRAWRNDRTRSWSKCASRGRRRERTWSRTSSRGRN